MKLLSQIKQALILLVDFIGLLIILSILLIVLNYFALLPLSKSFPKYLAFLPQISKNVKQSIYAPTSGL